MKIHRDTIAIIDYGSQYAHLIANRIRRVGVFSEIFEPDVALDKLKHMKGIILSGGPNDVTDTAAPAFDPALLTMGIPILGICYGHQLLAYHLGGSVESSTAREYGRAAIEVITPGTLLAGLAHTEEVWMSHGDSVQTVPEGFVILARTMECPVSAMEDTTRKFFGVQFHPEVTHTLHGMNILENFIFTVCGCRKSWSMEQYITEVSASIATAVGTKNVFVLVSGGVDSVVTFALLEKILGPDRVYGLHIDNGFMRMNESVEVKEYLQSAGFTNLHVVDASDKFLTAVENIADPEKKRRLIGDTFLEVAEEKMRALHLDPEEWVLAQGTIYPDTIETGRTKHADTIKTHHNRVPAVKTMLAEGKIIEPLSELYKDEVRELGRTLGLPEALIGRQPFPGPGLAVRVLCSDGTPDAIDATGAQERALSHGLNARVLPVRSVGVQGDNRTYAHPVVLIGDQEWNVLDRVSREITNSVRGINRVVWWCESEANLGVKDMIPDFRVERAYLTRERLELARKADRIVYDVMRTHAIEHEVWQFPVVLLPLTFDGGDNIHGEAVVLRPIESREAMTASFYRMERRILDEIVMKLEALAGVSAVFYDVTNKPPATIEWE